MTVNHSATTFEDEYPNWEDVKTREPDSDEINAFHEPPTILKPIEMTDTLAQVQLKLETLSSHYNNISVAFPFPSFVTMLNVLITNFNEDVAWSGDPPWTDIIHELVQGKTPCNDRTWDDIKQVVIHHSVTPPDFPPHGLAKYHVNSLDWCSIGYHFCVGPLGQIWYTAPMLKVTNHVYGQNTKSIGICLIGNFMSGKEPTDEQLYALNELLQWLDVKVFLHRTSIKIKVIGHKEVNQTACPGSTWPKWKPKVYGTTSKEG